MKHHGREFTGFRYAESRLTRFRSALKIWWDLRDGQWHNRYAGPAYINGKKVWQDWRRPEEGSWSILALMSGEQTLEVRESQ